MNTHYYKLIITEKQIRRDTIIRRNKIITFIYIDVISYFARPEDGHKLSRVVLLPGGQRL